jgi:hypothetical protein
VQDEDGDFKQTSIRLDSGHSVRCLSLGQLVIVEMVETFRTVREQVTFHMPEDEMPTDWNLT